MLNKIKIVFVFFIFISFNLKAKYFLRKIDFLNLGEIIDNFYTVEKDKLYRSRQLKPEDLDYYIKKYNIKTIINLRGVNKKDSWWQKERAIALKNNLLFFNISMRAGYLPTKNNLKKLINIYQLAPTPILIHCKYGADRTGEAAAVWQLFKGKNKKRALKELSLKYLHLKYRTPAKTFFIKQWQGVDWALNRYDPTIYTEFK